MTQIEFIVTLSLVTLAAAALWAGVQLVLVRRSQRKGRTSAFRHRESDYPTAKETGRRHDSGPER